MTKKLTPEEVAQMNRINARLPFNVAIDGKKAKPASETAAVIETPVSPTSEIVCDCMDTNLINITFMPCEKDGIVIPGKKPALILIRDSNKITLDRTIDNKPLAPGNYLMDVTSGDKTSRIVIEIK
jgi:hypothetical protein